VSFETLKSVLRDKLTKNVIRQFSRGSSYSRKNRLPTIRRVFQYPGDQYQADGSKLQFVCLDHTGKIITLTFYVVLDAYSRKVVGLSIDISENTNMVLQAFKYAFVSVKYLPGEIVVDNAPCYGSKEFQKFISNVRHFGVVWTFCPPDYPLAKAEVESFFSVFQKVICTKYPYYIGEGIKSKNEYGNPAEDLIKTYRKQKHLLMTRKDLSIMLVKMIKEYNDEYYKETLESVNAVPGTLEEKHDSIKVVYDIEAVLS
jgi:transposase InsO family protein